MTMGQESQEPVAETSATPLHYHTVPVQMHKFAEAKSYPPKHDPRSPTHVRGKFLGVFI